MSTKPLRVALIGMGRMGRAIDELAADRAIQIVARLGSADAAAGIDAATLCGADVAIEFTVPMHAVNNAVACMRAGCAVVLGTTGWSEQRAQLANAVQAHDGRVLWSPNFSVGVQLFLAVAEQAAMLMRRFDGFAAGIVETHHAAKLDAPSGTAIELGNLVSTALGAPVAITSVRVGSVPGTHELLFDAPFEQLRFTHEARDRRVFADGAIIAARWLARTPSSGLYTMRDVMRETTGVGVE